MSNITLPYNGWKPRPYQEEVWSAFFSDIKRFCIVAHRRYGKDELCLHWSCIALHMRVGSYWHCLPEYSQGRKAIWDSVNPLTGKRRIDEAFPKELRKSTNDQKMMITFLNGSTWQLVGSDSYDSLVGSNVCGVVFSEYAIADPESWNYIRPILAENNGWAIFISTVRGKNHFTSMAELAKNSPEWFHINQTVYDTNVFTAETLASELEELVSTHGPEIGQALFDQEYVNSEEVSILGSYITSSVLERSKGFTYQPNERDAMVWGVDVARFGSDANCLVRRIGRKVVSIERWNGLDTCQTADKIANLYQQAQSKPQKIFVDGGGVGAGVVDQLKRLLPSGVLDEVNFSSTPDKPTMYLNKRAEMWGNMKDAINAGLELPTDQKLTRDLVAPHYKFTNKNQIQLESKEHMSKRGVKSPDTGDALALTYARPVYKRTVNMNYQHFNAF